MPCFKGLAVSIHTPDGPLSEHSIQRQARLSRITSYIPVPPPKVPPGSTKPEQSTFAISITLLTPGMNVPYSTPRPAPQNPFPKPQVVGGLPGVGRDRGKYLGTIGPYESLTSSVNETVAAYIYFDGRAKEEVATLLRRGEETWVNSRWVSVPESEGGGLAEREFLFREVGLERWLNGLDLQGKDVAAVVEKRRQRVQRSRRKKEGRGSPSLNSDDEDGPSQWRAKRYDKGVLKYGADASAPLEKLSEDEDMSSSDNADSEDDPIPESTGQIKVALFRVLASGEIKKGEYSPQFDAHDDDEDSSKGEGGNGEGETSNADHTTSFAKPKTLDPKTISTQTVTGIDGPDKPYAVFTFLYRGEKQLQKMGILKTRKAPESQNALTTTKRRSVQTDFSKLKPLKPGGALGFTGIRDDSSPHDKNGKGKNIDDMESDDDEDNEEKFVDADGEEVKNDVLTPEEAKKQGELADGVKKIRLKRQHSFDPPAPAASTSGLFAKSPVDSGTPPAAASPPLLSSAAFDPVADVRGEDEESKASAIIGSPLKKQRSSMPGLDSEVHKSSVDALARGLGFGYSPNMSAAGTSVGTSPNPNNGNNGTSGPGEGASNIIKGGFGAELPKPPPASEDKSKELPSTQEKGLGVSGVGDLKTQTIGEDVEL